MSIKNTKKIVILIFIFCSTFAAASTPFLAPFTLKNVSLEDQVFKNDKIILLEYNSIALPELVFDKKFTGKNCKINNQVVCGPNFRFFLKLDDANKLKVFTIKYQINGVEHSKSIQLLPDDFDDYIINGKSVSKQSIIFSRFSLNEAQKTNNYSELFILTPLGKISYYRRLPFVAIDFKAHNVFGKIYYSYLKVSATYAGITFLGHRVLLDNRLKQIKIFPELLDMHEFVLLSPDWYMSTKYELAQNTQGTYYINQELIEIKNNRKIFRWGINELFKQNYFVAHSFLAIFDGKLSVHQFHLNAFQILPNNELLLSLGHDSIIIIDKKTKKIKMSFGGVNDEFHLSKEQSLFHFHSPTFDSKNQTLLVFDNSFSGKSYRVVEYKINRSSKKVEMFSLISALKKVISSKMGSVEKQGNIYSISLGIKDLSGPDFIEQSGTKTNMTIIFKNPRSYSYRMYRADLEAL